MEPNFWHERWASNQIGFHERDGNDLLVAHCQTLSLDPASRVFVPLCGKTRDVGWLLAEGHAVAGVELSEVAVQQLFEELGVEPAVQKDDLLIRYSAPGLDIFVGDIFDLTPALLEPVDAIYDRAALVALPEDIRSRYVTHLMSATDHARQLLITFEYDQSRAEGPPFSITDEMVMEYYAAHYTVSPIATRAVAGGLKGKIDATESVYLLSRP